MRRIVIHLIVCFVGLSLSAAKVQTDFSKTVIESKHIAGTVYVLKKTRPLNYRGNLIEWYGNMCASVGPDGLLLVDNGFEEIVEKISTALQDIHNGELRFIINTHWHQDHTGANHVLGHQVPIIAHEKTRIEMTTETTDHIRRQMLAGKGLDEIKSQGLPEKWQSWSDANVVNALTTDQWIETVYQSLSEKNNDK